MKKIVVLLALLLIVGCTTTQKGAGVGAIIGGGLGAIIGNQSGHATEGALIGAGAGGLGGALVGEKMDNKFCPKCGKRFTGGNQYCPDDGTELKVIEK